MSGQCRSILSCRNFSGRPFRPIKRRSRVSPIIGHPVLPGGRFALSLEDLVVKKRNRMVIMMTQSDV